MRVVLLDNQDSFVWNLAQAFQTLGAEVLVRRSERIDVAGIAALAPGALVLSPGPGWPARAGASMAAVRAFEARVPILGVCLGHQAIGAAYGGTVARGTPCHGTTTPVHHDGAGLFAGLPAPLAAARYHSLVVREPLPEALVPLAHTGDGVLMALRHRTAPTFGVQFHPESFLTEAGVTLLANFLRCAA